MKNLKQKVTNTLRSFIVVSVLSAFTATHADDTEIFYTQNISNNLLFVLDTSGSMREKIVTQTIVGGGTTSSGGSIIDFTKSISNTADDASQTFEEQEEASAGAQTTSGNYLNFEPDNIVATRYRFNSNTFKRVGQSYRVGWRTNGTIQSVRIKNAYLKFFPSSSDSDNTSINITVEDAAHDYAYSNYWPNDYRNYYYHNDYPTISARPTGQSVVWNPSAWSEGSTETVDVTSLVQQLVDRSDWNKYTSWWSNYNNSFAFKFVTQSGKRVAYSYDGSPQYAPELHINYEYDVRYRVRRNQYVTQTFNQGTQWSWTKNSYDDAEQEWVDSSSQLELYEHELALDDEHLIGLRFNLDNTIPQDAVITDAYLELTADSGYTGNSGINIQIEDTGSAAAYSDGNPISGRQYHSGSQVEWNPDTWTQGEKYRTPELTAQIQRVVDNEDASILAFRLFNESAERKIYASDSSVANAPSLYIKYQDIGGATSGTGTGTGGTTVITEVLTRLEVMQQALDNALQIAPEVNVGLMKYSGMDSDNKFDHHEDKRHHFVGGVVYPISPIYEEATDHIGAFETRDNLPDPGTKKVREFLADVAYQWEPSGGTPIVDALYEAALYFRGEKMHYGKNKNNTENWNSTGAHPSSYIGGAEINQSIQQSGRSSIADANYKSPIKNECQASYLVVMSDGEPTNYYSGSPSWGKSKGAFSQYVDGSLSSGFNSGLANSISSCHTGNGEPGNTAEKFTAGTCGREITQYLANNDQMPDGGRGGNPGVEGDQPVKTFVIGFGHGLTDGAEDYLRSLVTVDGSGYYKAEHKQELETAFSNIFDTVAKTSNSLSSPGYSVNVKSGLEHEDDIYIPVFDRKNSSRWSGNLKKFKLVNSGDKRKIRGKNDKDAFDEFGAFSEDALDYWSQSPSSDPDGFEVEKGGVASLIDPVGRNVFSDLVCNGGCDLNVTANKLITTNTNITAESLGIDVQGLSSADISTSRNSLINFMRGWEDGYYDDSATNDADKGIKRRYMGDMLHTEPLVITYKKGNDSGSGKEQYIFAATNEGYLHAFDTSSTGANAGKEKFAFIPKELLSNSASLFQNEGTARDHKYGVDGILTYWHDDNGIKGVVDGDDKVYLYIGMRRGGRSYYALDITKMDEPKLLWKKTHTDTGMSLLGQTWSAPYLANVQMSDGSKKDVMIFSGGYDQAEDRDLDDKPKILDDSTVPVTATMGNNIYILDMHTGELLWDLDASMTASNPLTSSVPGGVRILDVNRNGIIDRMYFADTGGNVWRLDLSESLSKTGDTTSKLTKFASLGGSGSNSRKFYNEPDVATMSPDGKTIFAVSIGSGYRAHPQDKTIQDKMFVLRDTSPFHELADDFSPITMDELASVAITSGETTSLTQSGFDDSDKDKGWYLSFPANSGEKVLATAVTFDGVITFTSMVPQVVTDDVDVCKAPVSEGRFYAMNILTGEAGLNLDESEETTIDDRITDADAFITVVKGEIPGKPQIVFNAITKEVKTNGDGTVTKATCSHPVDIRNGKKLSQVTGYDACRLESVYWNDPVNE